MKSFNKNCQYFDQKLIPHHQQKSIHGFFVKTEQSPDQLQLHRNHSEIRNNQGMLITNYNNQNLCFTNTKSSNLPRGQSLTPNSQANSIYMNQFQNHYKKLEQIIKRQNQNLIDQNNFLKDQINRLYQRQGHYKNAINRSKEQIKLLKLENNIYQQRYYEVKLYINSVIERMNEMVLNNQEKQNQQLIKNSSLQMIVKLREELPYYSSQLNQKNPTAFTHFTSNENLNEDIQSQNNSYQNKNFQENTLNKLIVFESQQQQNTDQKETPLKGSKEDFSSIKKIRNLGANNEFCDYLNIKQQGSQYQSTPSGSKATNRKSNSQNLHLQQTFESNCQSKISKQIDDLTDESQALIYELKKTNNQDNEIKKKIIKISHKIRLLKLEMKNNDSYQKNNTTQILSPIIDQEAFIIDSDEKEKINLGKNFQNIKYKKHEKN